MNSNNGPQEVKIYEAGNKCDVEVIPTFLKNKLFDLAKKNYYGTKSKADIEAKLQKAKTARHQRLAVRGLKAKETNEIRERKASADCSKVIINIERHEMK